jgi:hypothetical protein
MAATGTVAAYWAQTPATVTIFGPNGNIKCGQSVTFRAVVRDGEGDRIANGGPVIWSFDSSPSGGDQIAPTQSDTDSHGRAETNVTFDCVPGDRVLRATADTASGTIVLQVHVKDQFEGQAGAAAVIGETGGANASSGQGGTNGAVARATGVLPNTSAAPGTSVATIIALVALVLAASLVVGRAVTRRG